MSKQAMRPKCHKAKVRTERISIVNQQTKSKKNEKYKMIQNVAEV